VVALERAKRHADVTMTSAGTEMSAVGPADISVDRSTVNGVSRSMGPTGQPHPEAERSGPRSGQVRKGKGARLPFLG
jgi:hypothetical protein